VLANNRIPFRSQVCDNFQAAPGFGNRSLDCKSLGPTRDYFALACAHNLERASSLYEALNEVRTGENGQAPARRALVANRGRGESDRRFVGQGYRASCGGEKLAIAQMVLAAPDVDWDLFKLSACENRERHVSSFESWN
jgi:hypothetical protein